MYRTDFWTLWEKARVGCFERIASKHVCYLGWNKSPAQVGCMRQVLGPGSWGRPRGIGWRGRWEGGSGWGIHVPPWLIHVNIWQNPLQYCKVISLQLIKINEKKKKEKKKESTCSAGPGFNSWIRKICWRRDRLPVLVFLGCPCDSAGKESACIVGDLCLIPGLGRSPGEGKGYPFQYSCLENSMDCIDLDCTGEFHGLVSQRLGHDWVS